MTIGRSGYITVELTGLFRDLCRSDDREHGRDESAPTRIGCVHDPNQSLPKSELDEN